MAETIAAELVPLPRGGSPAARVAGQTEQLASLTL